jgi:hypothetical protein
MDKIKGRRAVRITSKIGLIWAKNFAIQGLSSIVSSKVGISSFKDSTSDSDVKKATGNVQKIISVTVAACAIKYPNCSSSCGFPTLLQMTSLGKGASLTRNLKGVW